MTDKEGGTRKGSAAGSTAGAAAPPDGGQAQDASADGGALTDCVPYVSAGGAFTDWFNEKVRQLVNPTIRLGTKTASVVQLLPDGRLECSLHGEGGGEAQQFVAFEAQYLDQLVRKIAALGA
jgi:hypothetical protein